MSIHKNIKIKFFKDAIYILVISIISFLFFDFLISLYLKNSSEEIYAQQNYGFYELKKNYSGIELFGSKIFKVNTDKHGFRMPSKNINITNYKILFLGDSATYGMMNWENSYPGIYEEISKTKVLNGGVPSYSPTTYIHRYKKALNDKLLDDNHIVVIAIDISDVQDEAGHWFDPNSQNLKDIDHPINLSYFKKNLLKKESNKGIRVSLKKWAITNFKISLIIYRIIRFEFLNYNYLEPIMKTSRSAFTWSKFSDLEKFKATEGDNYTRGYLPLGVNGGLKKIKDKIMILKKLVDANNGHMVIFTYPWPAQLEFESKFDWIEYSRNICREIQCAGTIDIIGDLREYKKNNKNWYQELFINGDIHLNQNGNAIIANKIYNEIKRLNLD